MNNLTKPPIPSRLAAFDWYAPHQAWLGDESRHNAAGAKPARANLSEADLSGAVLWGANLTGADLRVAKLRGASLTGADLWGANLVDADLRGANLRGASLVDADLWGAKLRGAELPDGRAIDEWRADPLAGICTAPEARERAIAAWGNHTWRSCPMHAAHGWTSLDGAPKAKRLLVAAFVALFDGGHLPKPVVQPEVTP